MGAIEYIGGFGKGRGFGAGRYFGIHNPFDSRTNKLKDPFINLSLFCRIACEAIIAGKLGEARELVATNIAQRINMATISVRDLLKIDNYFYQHRGIPRSFTEEGLRRASLQGRKVLWEKVEVALDSRGMDDRGFLTGLIGRLVIWEPVEVAFPLLLKLARKHNYGCLAAIGAIEKTTDSKAVPFLLQALQDDLAIPDYDNIISRRELGRFQDKRTKLGSDYFEEFFSVECIEYEYTYGSYYPIRTAAAAALKTINATLQDKEVARALDMLVVKDDRPITKRKVVEA